MPINVTIYVNRHDLRKKKSKLPLDGMAKIERVFFYAYMKATRNVVV
ncbi:Unknown protein sequence [Pseudomonas amygdali pv. mellea]|nr:Unknown protein sequence [Pseudomonas amygdali pv. mellea]